MTWMLWRNDTEPKDIKTLTDFELMREAMKCDKILDKPKSMQGAMDYVALPYTKGKILAEAKRRGQEECDHTYEPVDRVMCVHCGDEKEVT